MTDPDDDPWPMPAYPTVGAKLAHAMGVATLNFNNLEFAFFRLCMRIRVGAVIAVGWIAPALADVVVIDGDTLRLDGVTHRLFGIDAPELHQACADGWPAGVMASEALSGLVRGRQVTCEPERDRYKRRSIDRYGRVIAVCRADGVDLGAAMVRAGQAWTFIRYSANYLPQESEARATRAGVHAHDCLPAWEWRARQRQ